LAVRFAGDAQAFGWTTASYWYGWRHPEYPLPSGALTAEVEIQTGDRLFLERIHFNNPDGNFERFGLETELA